MTRILVVAEKSLANIVLGVLVGMILLVTVDVSGRYLFNHPLGASIEISEIMMAAAVFLPLAYTQALKSHLAINLITDRLPPKAQMICSLVANVLGLLLFVLLVWYGTGRAWDALQLKEVPPGVSIPWWPARMLLPLGSLFMCFRYIADIAKNVTQLRKDLAV